MENWLESIEDKNLSKDVKKNILVTGGSICSMFLGVDVNDYDVYIQNMDVLLRLTEYYTKNFGNIIVFDGRKKDSYLKEYAKDNGRNEIDDDHLSAYLVSVRNLKENQIKLFFNERDGGFAVEHEDLKENSYAPVFFSPNAISLSDKVQIVIRFNGNSEQIHKTFDYIHATNYFTFEDGLVTNIKALESILTKQLYYQGSLYPLTSVIRMKKFIKRNWNISAGEILKILFQVSELDLTDPDVLEEQLIGVDVAYFNKLISILRGVDTKNMTSLYLNAIIDKVFNSSEDIEE